VRDGAERERDDETRGRGLVPPLCAPRQKTRAPNNDAKNPNTKRRPKKPTGRLIELVPKHIMLATSCGIGLFLAHIGLQQAEGIGLVTANGATIVELGGCPVKNRVPYYFVPSPEAVCVPGPDGKVTANLGPKSSNYGCKGKRMHSPTMHLGIWSAGLVIVLMYYEVKAAIMFGVVFATVIAWIPGSSVSYLSESGDIPGGAERFANFRKVAELPNPGKTAGLLDFSFVYNGQAWVAFLTLIYLDFLGELDVFF
jgi:AGZA family xanthine/uracil permease-like MFS transporter